MNVRVRRLLSRWKIRVNQRLGDGAPMAATPGAALSQRSIRSPLLARPAFLAQASPSANLLSATTPLNQSKREE
jgi:hypothetical protein